MPGAAKLRIFDHGIEGWYRAVELTGDDADRLKVGHRFLCNLGRMRIVGLARKRVPVTEDGVVVLVAPVQQTS